MMDLTLDYSRLALELEHQELQSIGGVASPQIYGQLLAIYLLTNDLSNAKLLWKRIPSNVKTENAELGAIWKIATKLWNRDFGAIYELLVDYEWPQHLKNVINCIGELTRRRAVNLISKGFNSISLNDVSVYVGLPLHETISMVENLGWTIDHDSGFVMPLKPSTNAEEATSSEENLGKMTEYVAFLEN